MEPQPPYTVNMSVDPVRSREKISSPKISDVVLPTMMGLSFILSFTSCLLYNSQIIKFFGGSTFEILNRSIYVIIGISFILGMLAGEFIAALLCFIVFLYLSVMSGVGSLLTIEGYQNSLLLSYVAVLMSPNCAYLFRINRSKSVYAYVKLALILYFCLYLYFYFTLDASNFKKSGGGFIMASGDRGARILIDATSVSLGIFCSLAGLKAKQWKLTNLLLLILSSTCLFLSETRALLIVITLLSIVYILFGIRDRLWTYFLAVFLIITALLFSSFWAGANIYSLFLPDPSAFARMQELDSIRSTMTDLTLLFGNGFFNPVATDLYEKVDYARMVFWNDMGLYGILYATGFVGLIMYVILSCVAIKSNYIFERSRLDSVASHSFSMSLLTLSLFGILAPTLWTSSLPLVSLLIAGYSSTIKVRR